MTGQYVCFPTPDDARVTLRHDSGQVFTGVHDVSFHGRRATRVPIDKEIPNGHGAELRIEAKGYQPYVAHGVLWLDRLNPETGSVGFDVDTVTLQKAGSRPFV